MTEFAFLGTSTAEGWESWTADGTVVEGGTVHLRREEFPDYVDPRAVVELAPSAPPVVAIDVDDCGDLYLLRASGHVDRVGTERDEYKSTRLGCGPVGPDGGTARTLSVTDTTIYVGSVTSDPTGGSTPSGAITAVARRLHQRRWRTVTEGAAPVAMADDGDRVFGLFETDGDGHLATVEPDGTVATVLEGLPGPLDVAVDAGGTATLLSMPADRTELRQVETDTLDPAAPVTAPGATGVSVPTGATCLAAGVDGELLVGRRGSAAGEVTLFRVRGTRCDPIASSDSDLARLHLVPEGDLYAVETGGRIVTAFDARTPYVSDDRTGAYVGSVTRSFDSGERGTAWHRLTLGFSVREGDVQVRVAYAATDDRGEARDIDWQWIDQANPHDALFEDAVGRYLWLRVELQGARFSTPRLHTLRAYFPRQSYLRHLPAIYQADAESRAFLERFLSIFESEFVGIEEEIEAITRYLDPAGVPSAFLDWLGDWLALDPDETWPEGAHRDLLAAAPALFKDRGTPDGLLTLLQLYVSAVADPSPAWQAIRERQLEAVDERETRGELSPADARTLRRRIESDVFLLEYTDLDCATGQSREPYERLLPCPQCFFVFVRPFLDDDAMETVQRLVDDNRPASAVGRAVELEPSIVLGGHAYLGVNSVLPSRDLVVGEGNLGQDSVLDTHEAAGQLGVRSTLGDDTELS